MLGNLGALVHVKRRHPDQIICVCGCMAQEQHVADKIRQSFRHVDLVFGPHVLWKFPEFIHTLLTSRGRIFQIPDEAGSIAEGIPVVRQDKVKAWVSIMYGLQQLLLLLHRPLCPGRGALPEAGGHFERGAGTGWPRATRTSPLLGQNVNSYRQGPGGTHGLRRPAGAGECRSRGLPHPVYDLPPQGRHPEAL